MTPICSVIAHGVKVRIYRDQERDRMGECGTVPAGLCYRFEATFEGHNINRTRWLTQAPRITEERLRHVAETFIHDAKRGARTPIGEPCENES